MALTWVLASNNQGKIREIQAVLEPFDIILRPQAELGVEEIPETGQTFIENAIIKARHAAKVTNLPALADDSGIAVDALGGAPGIYSARFAGLGASDSDNIEKLLNNLQTIPDAERTAHYYCALVLMQHATDPTPWLCEGKWSGRLLNAPRGDGGFGYDPVFQITGRTETAAEIDAVEKNRISHRGQALHQLLGRLQTEVRN